MNNITGFIASRLLRTGKKVSLLSVLTYISITGVTLGTAVLVVVLSVFNGFFVLIRDMMLSYDPDIRIESASAGRMPVSDSLLIVLRSHPEISLASPYVEGKAMLSHRGYQSKVVLVRGVEPKSFYPLLVQPSPVTLGTADLETKDGKAGLLLGETLMDKLRLTIGDQVGLISANAITRMLTQPGLNVGTTFELRGGFEFKPVIDGSLAFTSLSSAQRIFRANGQWSGIDIKLTNFDRAEVVARQLQAALGEAYRIRTWYELHKSVYDVMFLEKRVSYAVLLLIVFVAALNILSSLTMIVLQKTRDIGVLRTMGLTAGQIKRIFLRQGFTIGLIGSGIGGTVGTLAAWAQRDLGLVKLAGAESFIIDAYPVVLQLQDIAVVTIGSLLLCVGAAWYPAWRASKVEPAEAVRYE
jgi:lipoprotein-releasing system permease protein